MDSLDYWRLCEELSINQAAHLLIGWDPNEVRSRTLAGVTFSLEMKAQYQSDLDAASTAITNALRRGAIEGKQVPCYKKDENEPWDIPIKDSVDPDASRIDVESLRRWLSSKGVKTGFFFPLLTDDPDYLDPRNPRYAPKLAAAVRAWQAVTETNGKPPKQMLVKWLREHAADFGLTDDDGKQNESGIEEVAKVANWQPSGGAPKTPQNPPTS